MDTEPTIDHEQGNDLPTPTLEIDPSVEASMALDSEDTSTEEVTETPEVDGVAEVVAEAAENAQALEETPEWEPTYKYKVRDEEHEIDEWARGYIKDEETQKKFVDLYTRGHGLELAKQEREELQGKYDEVNTSYGNIDKSLNILNGYVQEYYKNPQQGGEAAAKFIRDAQLPPEMFMQYALSQLKYQELPPEEKAQIDAQRHQDTQMQQMQMQNQTLMEQNEHIAVQQRTMELNQKLAEVTTSGVADEYDTRVGKQGAFFELVKERGIFHAKVHNTDITVEQAVAEAQQITGIQAGTPVQPQTGNVGTQPPVQQTHAQKKPVLPNISGQGTASPVKRVVSSIEDIHKRREELLAQGQ